MAIVQIYAVVLLSVAVFSALGIWFPGLRATWKGSKVTAGPLTCGSLGLAFGSIGLLGLFDEPTRQKHGAWFAVVFVIGFLGGIVGGWLDARAHERKLALI